MSTSYGPGRYDPQYEDRGLDYPYAHVRWTEGRNLEAFLALVARGSVDVRPLVTHEFAIEEAGAAYDLVTGGKRESFLGIALRYDGDARAPLAPAEAPRASGRGDGVRIGVIGAGQFGTAVLLPALKAAAGARLTAVATGSGSTADAVKRTFGFARAAADAREILGAADVDAVVVATRHDSHARLAAAALAAGRPCFVEKPLAITAEDLARVVLAMRATPGLVCVGFNRRFAPATVALRKQLGSRTSPMHARCRVNAGAIPASHWTRDPEVGGGRIVGEACHMVDLCGYLVGAPATSVFARALGRDPEVDDSTLLVLGFADGSTAAISYLANASTDLPKERFEVSADGRTAACENFRETRLPGGKRHKTLNQDKGQTEAVKSVIEAVRTGAPSPFTLDELLATSRATLRAAESAASGRAVGLDEGASRYSA
jgi:predicted dehydrogenase